MRNLAIVFKLLPGFFTGVWGMVGGGAGWGGMGISAFWAWGLWGEQAWAVTKVESSARAPCLPTFILLLSFSATLLVVSILDIVYGCHLRSLLHS